MRSLWEAWAQRFAGSAAGRKNPGMNGSPASSPALDSAHHGFTGKLKGGGICPTSQKRKLKQRGRVTRPQAHSW